MTERHAEERLGEHVKDKMLSSLVGSISFFLIRGTHLSSEDKRRTDSWYFSHSISPLPLFLPLSACHLINYTLPSLCYNNHCRLINSMPQS